MSNGPVYSDTITSFLPIVVDVMPSAPVRAVPEQPSAPGLAKTTPVKANRLRFCEARTLIACGRPASWHHFDGVKGVYLCDDCLKAAGGG